MVDEILARTSSSGATAWYLTDKLGSVRDIVSSSGTESDHIVYDSFGNILTETNATNGDRFKFAGMEYDSVTGQHYDRARYYDSALGRFVSQDPKGFAAADVNLFRYVDNSVLNNTDYSGTCITIVDAYNIILAASALQQRENLINMIQTYELKQRIMYVSFANSMALQGRILDAQYKAMAAREKILNQRYIDSEKAEDFIQWQRMLVAMGGVQQQIQTLHARYLNYLSAANSALYVLEEINYYQQRNNMSGGNSGFSNY